MSQPCPDDVAPLVATGTDPAKWMIIGVVAAIIGYELLAMLMGWKTISQYTQAKSAKYPWVKWTLFPVLGLLVWHLIQGGPL